MLIILQTDPGVPVVYAGFGALMLTTCISFLSHSQVTFLLLLFNLSAPCSIEPIAKSKYVDSSSRSRTLSGCFLLLSFWLL